MTNFIVYRQMLNADRAINDTFGPCKSYESAAKLAAKVRTWTDDNLMWVGIRQVYTAKDAERVSRQRVNKD